MRRPTNILRIWGDRKLNLFSVFAVKFDHSIVAEMSMRRAPPPPPAPADLDRHFSA